MKRCIILLFMFVVSLATFCCATTGATDAQKSSNCPPPGTEVPFAKLVTPGFAQDYDGCNISTVAQFVAPGTGAWSLTVPIEGKVVFRVLPPGVAGEKNPLSGEINADLVVIPKEAGDLVYSLKAGDLIRLTGGNYVKMHLRVNHLEIVFIANTMERAQQK